MYGQPKCFNLPGAQAPIILWNTRPLAHPLIWAIIFSAHMYGGGGILGLFFLPKQAILSTFCFGVWLFYPMFVKTWHKLVFPFVKFIKYKVAGDTSWMFQMWNWFSGYNLVFGLWRSTNKLLPSWTKLCTLCTHDQMFLLHCTKSLQPFYSPPLVSTVRTGMPKV